MNLVHDKAKDMLDGMLEYASKDMIFNGRPDHRDTWR